MSTRASQDGGDFATYARLTAFSLSSSSFFFCFSWFSFLHMFIGYWEVYFSRARHVQSDIVRVQHPLHRRELASLLCLDLQHREQKPTFLPQPTYHRVCRYD